MQRWDEVHERGGARVRDFLAAAKDVVRRPSPTSMRHFGSQVMRVLSAPYQARPLQPWVGPAWTIFLLVTALQRGSDLISAPDGRGEISAWVNVIGNHAYGWMLLSLAAALMLAAAIHKVIWLVIAHGFGIGLYVMYGTALLQGALASEGTNGWRYGVGMLLVAVLHAGRLVALRDEIRSPQS